MRGTVRSCSKEDVDRPFEACRTTLISVLELRTVDGVLRLAIAPAAPARDQQRWDEASRARFDPETTPPPASLHAPAFDDPWGAGDGDRQTSRPSSGMRVRARGRRRG
eukprot:7165871-Prymnesium_polylepis.1